MLGLGTAHRLPWYQAAVALRELKSNGRSTHGNCLRGVSRSYDSTEPAGDARVGPWRRYGEPGVRGDVAPAGESRKATTNSGMRCASENSSERRTSEGR